MNNAFVYGTLMYPSVRNRFLNKEHTILPNAELKGHKVLTVPGASFPGMVEGDEDIIAKGQVIVSLDANEMANLDRYESEGSLYSRVQVNVDVGGDELMPAWAYLFLHETVDTEWKPDESRLQDTK